MQHFKWIRIQGFDDQKLKKNIQLKIFFVFFDKKIAIYWSLSLHGIKDVQATGKEDIQHLKK